MIKWLTILLSSCVLLGNAQKNDPDFYPKLDLEGKDTLETWHGIKYIVTEENPDGAVAEKGDVVVVHYVGYLEDGTIFDASYDNGIPFRFRLDKMEVIRGWDIMFGILRQGEKARLLIPFRFGYGRPGNPPVIPRKADLTFDVEVMAVIKQN